MDVHAKYMKQALELARRGRGFTSPNPMVGAVLVKNNKIIGQGYHKQFGASHAEVSAIEQAGIDTKGSSLYVNLEPCCFKGKTPPCVNEIIQTGIKEVFIAMIDPNPKVNGNGVRILEEAGVKVHVGILENEARDLNRGFVHLVEKQRPWITLKMGQTADGYIADVSGKSRWITSTEARKYVREQRLRHDAIMVGMGTVYKDDPGLLPDERDGFIPYRVILDDSLNIPRQMKLITDNFKNRTIILTSQLEKAKRVARLEKLGINVLPVESDSFGWVLLSDALARLGEFGITSIYCEGGSQLAGSLIQEELVDELQLFIAPKILGEGISTFSGFMKSLDNAIHLEWTEPRKLGQDILLRGKLR
jgi:diaminohydroxyphosphoribosylaminopyrimidine deaminase/5-amino-6-(5-phosphoribosylamino)uracil reductase